MRLGETLFGLDLIRLSKNERQKLWAIRVMLLWVWLIQGLGATLTLVKRKWFLLECLGLPLFWSQPPFTVARPPAGNWRSIGTQGPTHRAPYLLRHHRLLRGSSWVGEAVLSLLERSRSCFQGLLHSTLPSTWVKNQDQDHLHRTQEIGRGLWDGGTDPPGRLVHPSWEALAP